MVCKDGNILVDVCEDCGGEATGKSRKNNGHALDSHQAARMLSWATVGCSRGQWGRWFWDYLGIAVRQSFPPQRLALTCEPEVHLVGPGALCVPVFSADSSPNWIRDPQTPA